MKRRSHNKILGLAIGERSLLAAEVGAGERPELRRVAEFVYPDGASAERLAEMGPALLEFLREHQFTARHAVIGIPARWLLVKSKEVPPVEGDTLSDLLRIQAEGEFSSELKDLIYDYASEDGPARSVLLMATPRKYVDGAVALCEAAKLSAVAVTASATVLGAATARVTVKNAMVLAIGPGGAELTAQSGGTSSAIRHLRAPASKPLFVSELRRVVSTMPVNGAVRELVVWDGAGIDADSLGKSLGIPVRSGDLASLGVSSGADVNGTEQKYGAAVSLALAGIGERPLPVDFLHSRLAPVVKGRISRPMVLGVLAAIMLVVGMIYAWHDLQQQQAAVDADRKSFENQQPAIKAAEAFVTKVSFAQGWHGGDPRYLACVRDITLAIPDDEQTYATGLVVRDEQRPTGSSGAPKPPASRSLTGQLTGKAPNQQRVQVVIDQMQRNRAFTQAKLGSTQNNGRNGEVAFSIDFTYLPPPVRTAP